MTEIQNTFINILKSYIWDETIVLPYDTDFSELFNLSKIHEVTGIVAAVGRKCGYLVPADIIKKFDASLVASVFYSADCDSVYAEVSSALAEKSIKNIAVKGPVIKRYYPDPDLRTMGDIDLVIHKDDMANARKVVESLGFEIEECGVDEYKYIRNKSCVELHEDLTSKDFGNNVDYKEEMQKIFDNIKNPDEFSQELTDEFHLVYMILHIASHLVGRGCGVRQLMDIALLLKKTDIDMDIVWRELESLKLTRLAHNIFYLCNVWFGVKCDEYVADSKLYETLSDYIILGGVFGDGEDRENNGTLRESYRKSTLGFLFARAFPPIAYMRASIGWFREKPAFLLPIAWVYRWIRSYTDHSSKINEYLKKAVVTGDETTAKELEMLRELGFYENKK